MISIEWPSIYILRSSPAKLVIVKFYLLFSYDNKTVSGSSHAPIFLIYFSTNV